MAVTLTKLDEDVWGKITVRWYNILLDSSYPTGGYGASLGLSLQRLGYKSGLLLGATVLGVNAAGSGIVRVVWDYANNKLMAFRAPVPTGTVAAPTFTGSALGNHTHDLLLKNAAVADGATTRVNAGSNLLGANTGGDLTVTGAGANGGVVNASGGTPAGTNSAPAFTGTAGGINMLQVPNATSLSAVTVRMRFEGR